MIRLTSTRRLSTAYSEATVAQALKLTNYIQQRDWPKAERLSGLLPQPLVTQCFSLDWANQINEKQSIPTNIIARFLAASDDPVKETYRFLVQSIATTGTVDHKLVEPYLWNLLVNESSPRMALVATVFNIIVSQTTVTLSNELWSLLITRTCELSDYPTAIIVYHQVIQDKPFLVTPQVLQALGSIFATNNDYVRVKGLLSYFNEFYSYQLHPTTLRTLKIMLVEACASTDFVTSLSEFRSLCLLFKGHSKLHWHYHHHLMKNTIANGYVSRRHAIAENKPRASIDGDSNGSDEAADCIFKQEQQLATETGMTLFQPLIQRNVYTTTNNHIPLIDGVLRTSDLPQFYQQFHRHITSLLVNHSSHELVETLRQRIIKTHYMLTVFVVRLLCESSKFQEALMLMEVLGEKSMNYKTPFLIKEENFYMFGTHCNDYKLLIECLQFYVDACVKFNYRLSSKVMAAFLTSMLNHADQVRLTDLEHFLACYWKHGDPKTVIKLSIESWNLLLTKVDIKRFNFIQSYTK